MSVAAPAPTSKQPRLRRRGRIDVATASKPARENPSSKEPKPKVRPLITAEPATKTAKRPPARTSALDAAAQVLAGLSAAQAASGLSAAELIERMHRDGLWTSPSGRTPSATLYAAMIREIAKRKSDARFIRVAAGKFAAAPTKPVARSVAKARKASAGGGE